MKKFECDIPANNKEWLYEEYVTNQKSLRQIAKFCNVSEDTIRTRLNKFGIKIRGPKESNKISGKSYKKRPATKEEKEARVEKLKNGTNLYCINCGNSFYAPKCREDRKYCSIECRNEYWSKNINRNQDWRDWPEYREWRNNVYRRDCWKCKICGSKEKINAHHIFEGADYPEKRFDVDNGITLCEKHHIQIHKYISSFIEESIKQTPNIGGTLEADNPEALIKEFLNSLIRSNDYQGATRTVDGIV